MEANEKTHNENGDGSVDEAETGTGPAVETCRGTQDGNGDASGDGNEGSIGDGSGDEDMNGDGNEDGIRVGGREVKKRKKPN